LAAFYMKAYGYPRHLGLDSNSGDSTENQSFEHQPKQKLFISGV
jgi:hypothetical protein